MKPETVTNSIRGMAAVSFVAAVVLIGGITKAIIGQHHAAGKIKDKQIREREKELGR